MGGKSDVPLLVDGKRCDGRRVDEMRPITVSVGVLEKAIGSAYVELGNNKVIAGVYGPKECIPKHHSDPYRAIVKARYTMAPFSTDEHGRAGPNRRSTELSKVIRHVFENLIFLEVYPRTQIEIYMEVLQADGSTRCAAINAASVALANAGIQVRDLVAAVSVGKVENQVILDLKREEDNFGQSDMPIAFASRNKEVLLYQMDGKLTREEMEKAFGMARNAADLIFEKQREALKAAYAKDGAVIEEQG